MKNNYKSILNDVVSDRLDYILNDLKNNSPKIRKKEINLIRLSKEVQRVISGLDSNEKDVIDEYMSAINAITYDYNSAVYVEGFRDCVSFLKGIGVI
ncbi:hypothetical protein R9X47_10555 [Wukongibacter baidiensis]|uniref:hypothetical protein n=1 Tax=Wukongibacter baidiensis TaxID=1723361 RepID=UPI003D7FA4FF